MREIASRRLETKKLAPNFIFLLECLQILCCAGVIAMNLFKFVAAPMTIYGISMEPSLHNGQRAIYHPLSDIQKGDVIIFRHGRYQLIKRVMADEYDAVAMNDGVLTLYDDETGEISRYLLGGQDFERFILEEDTYWVVGDNRSHSNDSRMIGSIEQEDILGEVSIVWDALLSNIQTVPKIAYIEVPFTKQLEMSNK